MQIAGFTGCGESSFLCHSERSEESLRVLKSTETEIPRFARNDIRIRALFPQPLQPVGLVRTTSDDAATNPRRLTPAPPVR
jgi:hypothetical protein